MINESYKHENIVVSEQDILQWKQHKTFREELCVYINADNGKKAASGIAEFDEVCREGIIEWVQVLPAQRQRPWEKDCGCITQQTQKHRSEFCNGFRESRQHVQTAGTVQKVRIHR